MRNVLDCLEEIGRDAHLRHAGRAELVDVLTRKRVDVFVQKVMMDGSARQLEVVLGAEANVCCLIHVPQADDDRAAQEKGVSETAAAA